MYRWHFCQACDFELCGVSMRQCCQSQTQSHSLVEMVPRFRGPGSSGLGGLHLGRLHAYCAPAHSRHFNDVCSMPRGRCSQDSSQRASIQAKARVISPGSMAVIYRLLLCPDSAGLACSLFCGAQTHTCWFPSEGCGLWLCSDLGSYLDPGQV
jgi:hypothetical protein